MYPGIPYKKSIEQEANSLKNKQICVKIFLKNSFSLQMV